MPDPYVPPFGGPYSIGTGTVGQELGGRPLTVGRNVDYGINPNQPDGPGGGDATAILPRWRLSIYWDGTGSPATDYLDRPFASLPSAEPRVMDWGQLVQTAKGLASFDSLTLRVVNAPDTGGARFADNWSAANPPEGKRVELYLLVGAAWQVEFTGEIAEVPEHDELEVTLVCGSIAEALDRDVLQPITSDDWPSAPGASLKRYQPAVLGNVDKVEGVLVEANLAAVLASSLTSTATTVEIEEDPGLPSAGAVLIDSERITYTGVTPGEPATLTGVVRGTDSTTATDHPAGSLVIEDGTLTWLFCSHAATLTNPRLVDGDGNVRNLPANVTPTIDGAGPTTVQLDRQPVLNASSASQGRAFKFVDLDTAELGQSDSGFAAAEIERALGRSDEYTETNFVELSSSDGTRQYVTGSRTAPLVGLPDGATLVRAYAVVEHHLPALAAENETALAGALAAAATGDILVDDVSAFPSSGTIYVGEERITYTGTTTIPSDRFTGISRGENAAGPLDHPDGARVVQSAVEVRVRVGAGATGLTDGEGFAELAPTAPEQVQQDTGLSAVSKGFEDAHTHTVSGSHDHDATTVHDHKSPTIIEWQPSLIQVRSPTAPTGPCNNTPPAWLAVANLLSDEWGNAVDNNLSTSIDFAYSPVQVPTGAHAFYLLRSTSADLSPSDERTVKSIEVSIAVSKSLGSPGSSTITWDFDSGLGICKLKETVNGTSLGVPRLNVGTSFDEGAISFGTSNPDGFGSILSEPLPLDVDPDDLIAEPSTIFTKTFQIDVAGLGLEVRDLVDQDYGGLTGRSVWISWKAPNCDVHSIHCRLVVENTTGEATIADPLDSVAWPDTDEASPLLYSSLTWFDLGEKVTSPADLLDATIQVNHRQASPYVADAKILRMFFVLELADVTLSGSTEAPTRLIADVVGLPGVKGTDHAATVLTTLLGEVAGDVIDSASLAAAGAMVPYQTRGVVYDQVSAPALLAELGDASRVTFWWNAEGKLSAAFRADRGALPAPVFTFRAKHLLPMAAGPPRHRAPLSQLINSAEVLAAPDPLEPGAFTLSHVSADAASIAAYGRTVSRTVLGRFLYDAAAAENLADHVIDYNASLPERVVFAVHIDDTDTFAPALGDVVGLDTPELVSSALVVERRVVEPGNGRDGKHALVRYTAVDRS